MLEIIKNFQLQVYEILNHNNHKLFEVNEIYLAVPRDAKYPFIIINLLDLKNQSRFDQVIYEINFNIVVFLKDKPQSGLINIGHGVVKALDSKNFKVDNFIINGLRAAKMAFENSQDLMTSKLIISYLANIKQ